MQTYPLRSRSLEEAKELQFRIVDAATRHFVNGEMLDLGDLGVHGGTNRPLQTVRVERVIAGAFDVEDAVLVRGAGTGALRWSLLAAFGPGTSILVHEAPVYTTTATSLAAMGCHVIRANYNDESSLREVCTESRERLAGALIQHSRQKMDDSYDLACVISCIRESLPGAPIVTDENYAACRSQYLGAQTGASLSAFSCFKLLGPEGVGVVLGDASLVGRVRELQYSGGSQVQGHEAMAALRGLIYAPVMIAISEEARREVVERLCEGEVPHVANACRANSESGDIIVELDADMASNVLEAAPSFGAAPHPVGCESRYEFCPLFYRISGAFRSMDSSWERRMVRINPMRAGADTVIRILREAIGAAYSDGEAPGREYVS